MFKIEKLLNDLCADGVAYKKIGDVAEVGTGSSNGNEAIEDGVYPFFIRSQTIKYKNDFEYDEEAIIIPGEGGIGDIYHYINGKYALHQRVYRIHFINEDIDTKFAYYYFHSQFKIYIMKKAVSATVTSIRKPMIENFLLPVPPLEVQREIVRILDNFTGETNELLSKLTLELDARKKQYAYYCRTALAFRDSTPIVKLEEVASYSKDRIAIDYLNENNYVGVENLLQNKAGKRNAEKVPTGTGNATGYCSDDILIGNIRPYLKKIWLADCDGGTNGDVLVIRSQNKSILTPQYLYCVLSSDDFFDYDTKNSKGAKMPRGD